MEGSGMSGDGITKNRGGRPAERGEAKRSPINMRTTPATRAALEAAAERGGRSLAQEIEQRLERSIEQERQLGGPQTAALISAILSDIAAIEEITGDRWYKDIKTFGAVRYAMKEQIEDRMPMPRESVHAATGNLAGVEAVMKITTAINNGAFPQVEGWNNNEAFTFIDRQMAAVDELFAQQEALAKEGEDIYNQIRAQQSLLTSQRNMRRGA
jgi:hypothetical protein